MSEEEKSPKIRYAHISTVKGPLSRFEEARPRILTDVVNQSLSEFSKDSYEMHLGEALFMERVRIRKSLRLSPAHLFTFPRSLSDKRIWSEVYSGLLRSSSEVNREQLVRSVMDHYAEEIGGHFSQSVYKFSTIAVPWGFSWLLNAASVQHFRPWKMPKLLQDRLHIQGEIEHLQKLSKKGTILLVPTHMSNIDSLLIGYVIYLMSLPPFSYGAGLNLFSNPVFSFFMSRLGAYTVDRMKSNQIYKSVLKNYSSRILEEGVHSIFFPGGGRSRSGAVESRLKLGLLGTGLSAQIENLRSGKKNPNIYVVPMTMSYHFVLEASSLIEQYLSYQGKHRFMGSSSGEDPWPIFKIINFFWKFFSKEASFHVRVGKPLDIFGNFVDEEGHSIGPNGTIIQPENWLKSQGEVKHVPQRDREYTRELGGKVVERLHAENVILSSHLLAFSLFMSLRKKYPDLDLYKFLRLSRAQRSIPYDRFLREAESCHNQVTAAMKQGRLQMSDALKRLSVEEWVEEGMRNLGVFHNSDVVKKKEGVIWTEDMNLLYFYRNRLAGYGLSLHGEYGRVSSRPGDYDEYGFLV